MLPQPKPEWFGVSGLTWTPRHTLAFGSLTILEPDPADPLHYAIGLAMSGSVPERRADVLRILAGVVAGEMMREGGQAGHLKTAAETFEAETVNALTGPPEKLTVAAATRRVRMNATYAGMVERRRVSEYRVRALAAYLGTIRDMQQQARTDQVDARGSSMVEGWEAT